ncbi:MAG: hypothetical protein AAGF95_03530 [Chloroflexota bacterium]
MVGVLGIVIIFPFVLPLILLLMLVSRIQAQQFGRRYAAFLAQHEGIEFFCYTNRANSQFFVEEQILPVLDPQVHIIQLQGRKANSAFDEAYVSHMLHNIDQVGFPVVMKIVNGRVLDRSLHDELYCIINQKRDPTLLVQAIEDRLTQLRGLAGEGV